MSLQTGGYWKGRAILIRQCCHFFENLRSERLTFKVCRRSSLTSTARWLTSIWIALSPLTWDVLRHRWQSGQSRCLRVSAKGGRRQKKGMARRPTEGDAAEGNRKQNAWMGPWRCKIVFQNSPGWQSTQPTLERWILLLDIFFILPRFLIRNSPASRAHSFENFRYLSMFFIFLDFII